MNGSLGVLAQQLQNAKLQADAAHSAPKQSDDLKPVFDQAFTKVVTTPADALQPLIPAAQTVTQQLVMVGDYIAQQGTQVSFVANGIQFPTSQQASEYNKPVSYTHLGAPPRQCFMLCVHHPYSAAQHAIKDVVKSIAIDI